MGILKRLFGGGEPAPAAPDEPPLTRNEIDAAEQQRDREMMRAESERLDELQQRQLRYSQYAWTPPAEGGPERADDVPGGAADE